MQGDQPAGEAARWDRAKTLIVVSAAMSMALVGYAWLGARLAAIGAVRPIWLGAGLLALWAVSGAIGAALTRRVRYGLLVVAIAVVAYTTLGNAAVAAVNHAHWSWSLAEPPYYLARALQMNLVLGLVIGGAAAWAASKWQQRRLPA